MQIQLNDTACRNELANLIAQVNPNVERGDVTEHFQSDGTVTHSYEWCMRFRWRGGFFARLFNLYPEVLFEIRNSVGEQLFRFYDPADSVTAPREATGWTDITILTHQRWLEPTVVAIAQRYEQQTGKHATIVFTQ